MKTKKSASELRTIARCRDWPEVLTLEECAMYLGVSPVTLRGWIKAGLVPVRKITSQIFRFSRREILDWIEQKNQISEQNDTPI